MILSLAPAQAGGPDPFNIPEAHEVSAAVGTDAAIARSFSTCPADVFARSKPFWGALLRRRTTAEACEAHPATCLRECRVLGQPGACFSLAVALQKHDAVVSDAIWERLFAQACAAGSPAGCTNRAAGMRNRYVTGDPFQRVSEPTRQLCEHRSFALACAHDDSWGCAMLGQSWRLGEGAAANALEAIRAYRKACELAPDFVACGFAKDGMDEMGSPL